ncbi:MAG: M13 family metallopeptidase [Gammaproteobacteria bacterium]
MNNELMKAAACIALALVLSGLGSAEAAAAQRAASPVTPDASTGKVKRAPIAGIAGIEKIDPATRLRPQDDFYAFVNSGWLGRNEIPADLSTWGAFEELDEQAELKVREIISSISATRDELSDPDLVKVADLYLSFMDEAAIESAGIDPIAAWLERIDAIADHEALAAAFGTVLAEGVIESLPFGYWVDLDYADSERYALYVMQSGLGLPDRDYYLLDNESMTTIREAYVAYIARLFALAGAEVDEAAAAARRVFELEGALAELHWTRAARRNAQLIYNPTAVDALPDIAPGFGWPAFLAAAGLADQEEIILRELSYFPAMATLFVATDVGTWRDYLRYKLLDQSAPLLDKGFVDARFDFHSRTLSGVPEQPEREKRAVYLIDEALGEAVGREYVARHFPPEHRARMEVMVANLKRAFRQSIASLEWMSEATKAEALAKLDAVGLKIGFPDDWRDYSALEIRADDLVGNAHRARRFNYELMIGRLRGPVDRGEWFLTPQTVNAFYMLARNEIVFPAAILNPPFFNPAADDAVNYGGIGAIIGHELSHGFDDQGRHTDGKGQLRGWWSEEDDARYRELAARLVEQYSAFEPIEGMNINGEVSLGENMADVAGVTLAHRAYRLSRGDGEAPVIDGYTGDQRYFMGWAQAWRTLYREDALRQQLVTRPHSPAPYRVFGVVRNIDAFHEAFGVKEGDGMWLAPEERVAIW